MSRRVGLAALAAAGLLVILAMGVVLLGRHWLEDWNDEIDRRWSPLRPHLDVRYQKLDAFDEQFRDAYGEHGFNRELDRLLKRWQRLYGQRNVEQEHEVDTANALELTARRMILYLRRSTDPRPSPELSTWMFAFARSGVPIRETRRFNEAADAYEKTRDSVLGAPAAHLLAYYGRSRLGLTIL